MPETEIFRNRPVKNTEKFNKKNKKMHVTLAYMKKKQ